VVAINIASSKNSCVFNVPFQSIINNYVVYCWPGASCLPGKFVYVFVSVKCVCYFKFIKCTKSLNAAPLGFVICPPYDMIYLLTATG